MKKMISLILLLALGLLLLGCENGVTVEAYSGKWVRERWINEQTGAEVGVTIYLNADGTFQKEVNNSVTGYEEYTGTWDIEDDTIVLQTLKMVAGPANMNYDDEGNVLDGVKLETKLTIIDSYNLENGGLKYSRAD